MPSTKPDRSFRVDTVSGRLDRLVADALGCGRRKARDMIRSGLVTVDGRRALPSTLPAPGATVSISTATLGREDAARARWQPRAGDAGVRVLWEGRGLIALFKPAGLHSQRGASPASVAAVLAQAYPGIAAVGDVEAEGGLVHRLDRDTSGLLLAAVERDAYLRLRRCFAAGRVEKFYLALVAGTVREAFTVTQPLARRRTRVVAARTGERVLPATTRFVPLAAGRNWSLLSASMRTGVTHQVRAHAALAGHPILGDHKYGGPDAPAGTRTGQLLHAYRIVVTAGPDLTAAVPADFLRAYALLLRATSS